MKFGYRTPSPKKKISAKTTGKITRKINKSTEPFYGEKGTGIYKDPEKAMYNNVYNKTTKNALSNNVISEFGSLIIMLIGSMVLLPFFWSLLDKINGILYFIVLILFLICALIQLVLFIAFSIFLGSLGYITNGIAIIAAITFMYFAMDYYNKQYVDETALDYFTIFFIFSWYIIAALACSLVIRLKRYNENK